MNAKKDWSQFRVLIVNDDGFGSTGIQKLESYARDFFSEVCVIAPSVECSGASHAISYRKSIALNRIDNCHYTVDGMPADCVLAGLHVVMKDNPPDLVLSGINHGDNTGGAIPYSGTVGAALESALHEIYSISLSQEKNAEGAVNFDTADYFFTHVMEKIKSIDWNPHVVMNVNFPACLASECTGIYLTSAQRKRIVKDVDHQQYPDGRSLITTRFERFDQDEGYGHDRDILVRKGISLTPVLSDWNCYGTLSRKDSN